MLSSHVSKNLSAYCHGELAEEESRRVAEHLIGCTRCRREFEEVRLGVKLAEQLPRVSAPDSLWHDIEAALDRTASRPTRPAPTAGRAWTLRWQLLAPAAAALLLALAAGLYWYSTRRQQPAPQSAQKQDAAQPAIAPQSTQAPDTPAETVNPPASGNTEVVASGNSNNGKTSGPASPVREGAATWEVARIAGAPKVGANSLEGKGRLAVGEWLETDASSRAKINVADIGQVDIGPNSRVRLVGTRSTEHRLALTRGRLHAMIMAPPRLFIVETPSATAVDLGCSYTLEVDDSGRSVLNVTSGWVALEHKGRESVVPAGAVCITEPGKGPGTPYFDDASAKFREALTRLDFRGGGAAALNVVLSEARSYDTLTLWHLLSRVREDERGRVFDRMAALATPPRGVTRDGVLRLNRRMLDSWKKELEGVWFG